VYSERFCFSPTVKLGMRDIYGQDTQKRIDALFQNLKVVADTDDGVIYTLNRE